MSNQVSLPERVVQAFGGLTKMASALDVPLTTVDGWRDKGRFPAWRVEAIREAAERNGVTLPNDFPEKKEVAA